MTKQTNAGYVDDAGENRKISKVYAAGSAMRGEVLYKVELEVVYFAVGWRRPAKAAVLF